MAKRNPFAATNANLLAHGLEPAMRWLIPVALDGSTMTYGQLAAKLESEVGFSKIFTTRIGVVAGGLMNRIQEVQPSAPLINVLVVNQKDRQPSEGAGSYLAERFGDERLRREDSKQRYPKIWEKNFTRAAGEVYSVTESEWANLFERVFDKPLDAETIEHNRNQKTNGTEEDGLPTGRRYGKGGEGPLHEALRLWVNVNPKAVHRDFSGATSETEVDLDSGDRVDVIYKCLDRIVVLEVKSRISNIIDLRRGVFQCIKYRAVRQAMDVRDKPNVEAVLVTEIALPGEIASLLKLHNIRHVQVPLDRR